MKKKTILLTALLCAAILAGCSTNGSDNGSSQPAAGASAAVESSVQSSTADEGSEEASKAESSKSEASVTESEDEGFEVDGITIRTIGDAMDLKGKNANIGVLGKNCFYAFETEKSSIRVVAEMPDEIFKSYNDIEFSDEDRNEKQNNILINLKITRMDDYTSEKPTPEELDQLIGKTGRELMDLGYEATGYGMSGGEAEFYYSKGMFGVNVIYNEKIEKTDDFDYAEAVEDLTIKSVELYGFSPNLFNLTDSDNSEVSEINEEQTSAVINMIG